jgi:hypothetical protein
MTQQLNLDQQSTAEIGYKQRTDITKSQPSAPVINKFTGIPVGSAKRGIQHALTVHLKKKEHKKDCNTKKDIKQKFTQKFPHHH